VEECLYALRALDAAGNLAGCAGSGRQGLRRQCMDDRCDDCSSPSRLGWSQRGGSEAIGASRGGLSTKIHAVVDANGAPIAFAITEGQTHEMTMAAHLLEDACETVVIADRGYDADSLIEGLRYRHCTVVIPPRSNRKRRRRFDRQVYRQRFRVECFFQRLKRFRRIGTRYDKRATNFLGMILLAAIALWVF
jgi:transposase